MANYDLHLTMRAPIARHLPLHSRNHCVTLTSVDGEAADAWERTILRNIVYGERLKEIPAGREQRDVVLHWLADRFQPGMRYPESAVNTPIGRQRPDIATLSRALIGAQRLRREHGVSWRVDRSSQGDTDDHPGGPGHDSPGSEPAGRLAEVAV